MQQNKKRKHNWPDLAHFYLFHVNMDVFLVVDTWQNKFIFPQRLLSRILQTSMNLYKSSRARRWRGKVVLTDRLPNKH